MKFPRSIRELKQRELTTKNNRFILALTSSIDKTDIGKPFDKSIIIDNSNLNVIDFIDQSIEIDTLNHRCSFKVLN